MTGHRTSHDEAVRVPRPQLLPKKRKDSDGTQSSVSEAEQKKPKRNHDSGSGSGGQNTTTRVWHEGNGKPYVTDDGVHMRALLHFPPPRHLQHSKKRIRRYILQRAAGDDVLQVLREHDMEGYLELPVPSQDDHTDNADSDNNATGESAHLYIRFPYHRGILAGRLDNIASICHNNNDHDNTNDTWTDEPCFFSMVCCQAYVNYGTWDGTVERRSSSLSGGPSTTNNNVTGLHFAEAGLETVSAQKPFYVDRIHSMEILRDQPDERDRFPKHQHFLFPEGYQPLTKGCLNFTLFLKRYYNQEIEEEAEAALCLIFRPETDEEQRQNNNGTSMIPRDVLDEIYQLPPSQHTRSTTK